MKKTTLLLTIFTILSVSMAKAVLVKSELIPVVNFTGLTALPTGWSVANDANYSLYGTGGSYNLTIPANKLNVTTGNSSKNQGVKITFPSSGSETEVYVEFDWTITSATVGSKNALGLTLKDNVAAAYTTTGDILILYCSGTDGMIHCQNIDNTSPVFQDVSASGSFLKSGTDAATCNTNNASTITTCGWAAGNTIHVNATLDFTNKKVSYLKLTNATTTTSYENTVGLNFLSSTAANLSKLCITNTRVSASGTGSNSVSNTAIDNFETYKMIEAAVAQVTINYVDQASNPIKSVQLSDKIVGSTYTASSTDKTTFVIDDYYYSYDAANTTSDNVVVLANGSAVITLKFSKTAVTPGPYTWTGITSSNWNDFDLNFTTTGSNSLAYQNGNSAVFDATAANKTVTLIKDFDLGANNVSVTGSGYSFDGSGGISGTESFVFDLGNTGIATINQKNYQAGGIVITSGDVTILNQLAGTKYTLGDGAKVTLQTGASFSKTITTTGTTATIQTNSNVFYTPTINGTATTINLILGVSGSMPGVDWSSKITSTMPTNAQVNVTTNQATAGYGVASGSLTTNKVNLGAGVRLLHNYNPAAGGATIIYVGELSGDATSTIEGGWVDGADRGLNYQIGASNTDATFNGVIKNYGSVTAAPLNIYKKGLGMWTLTGTSTFSPGLFNVDAGTVIMNGSLTGAAAPVIVAPGATLKGTGSITSPVTINGTLEGNLHFGSTLALAGTTNLTVTGFNPGEFDVLNVTGAVTNGGTLNINLLNEPTGTGTIKLIAAPDGTYSGTFTAVNINTPSAPSGVPTARRAKTAIGYSFDPLTGVLSYTDLGTGISELNNAAEIYPTLTRGEVYVNAENAATVDVLSLGGQLMKQLKTSGTRTTINLKGLADGAYLVKVRYTDGTDKTQQVILRK